MSTTPTVDTAAAGAYEAFLVPGSIAPWAEVIVTDASINDGMEVLDVACGTGVAARHAARRVGSSGRVVGADIDDGMLCVARTVSAQEGLAIEYAHASACELSFGAESFDAALCLQGLQYFADRPKAMSELRRVLRRNALLVSVTWSELQQTKGHWAIVRALERRNIDAVAVRKPFALADAAALRSLAVEAGFSEVSVRAERRVACFRSAIEFVDAMLKGSTSSRYAIEKVSSDDWPGFLSEVEDLLAPWKSRAGLEFPMESHVLVARR